MSVLKEVRCTSCQKPLRFRPPASSAVALTCPACGNCFEVRLQQPVVEVVPIVEPIEAKGAKIVQATVANPSGARPSVANPSGARPAGVDQAARKNIAENLDSRDLPAPLPPVRPVVRPQTIARPRKYTQNNSRLPSAVVFAALAGVSLVLGILLLFVTDTGQSILAGISSTSSTAEGIARQRNAIIDDCILAAEGVENEEDRAEATKELERYKTRLAQLVFSAAAIGDLDDARREIVRKELLKGKLKLADHEMEFSRLESGRTSFDPLVSQIQKLKFSANTIETILVDVSRAIREPNGPAEQICYDGIRVEKRALKSLASIESAADVDRAVSELQSLIDDFNRLAENQYENGERVSYPPRDYDTIEVAMETSRRWFVDHIQEELNPPASFELTVKDFDYVQNRFDNALFKSRIVKLSSNSRQRIEEQLSGGSTLSSGAPEYDASPDSTDSSVAGGGFVPAPGREDLTGSYYDRFADNNADYADGFGEDPDDNQGFGSDPYSDEFGSEPTNAQGGAFSAPPSRPGQSRPGQSRITPPRNSRPSGRETPSAGNGGTANFLTGNRSLTIRIVGGEKMDGQALCRKMASKLGTRQSFHAVDAGDLLLNFEYKGSLQDASRKVDFGVVELSDSQSRTLFVVVSP